MTPSDGEEDRFRHAIARELDDLAEDAFWSEKTHFAHAEELARVSTWLGLGSTVAASIAAGTVLAESAPAVTGICAVGAAIGSGLLTYLKPRDAESRHLIAARQLGALRVRLRQARRLDLPYSPNPDPEGWTARAREFAAAKAQIDDEAPGTSDRAMARARKKIEAGHFQHESDAGESQS